jgi:hypothetical protein
MLDLPCHYRVSNLLALEELYQAAHLAYAYPLDTFGRARYLGRSLFLDGGDNHLNAARARALKHKEWEAAIAGN